MQNGILALAVAVAVVSAPGRALAESIFPVSALFVFGDSLSDSGNGYALASYPPSPPFAQRWTNGPVAVERLAANLGIDLMPSMLGGTNYAVGGAATGQVPIPGGGGATTDNFGTLQGQTEFAGTGIDSQVAAFLGEAPAFDPAASLFVVWGGPNDFLIDSSAATAQNAVANLAGEIAALHDAGARHFLVPNMPDLSLTPSALARSPEEQQGLLLLSLAFNQGLATALDMLELGLPGANIIRFDTFTLLQMIVANPAAFGFANVNEPCFDGVTVCSDPDQYLSWDGFHPTARAHQSLGDLFTGAVVGEQVPEPASVLLVGIGVAGVLLSRRHR